MLRPDFQPPSKDRYLPGEMRDDPKTAQAERGVAWWKILSNRNTEHAIYATPSVERFPLPTARYPNVEIFPSTSLPPGNACIEVTIIHEPWGSFNGYFNHCAAHPDWLVMEDMNSSVWLDRYARDFNLNYGLHVIQQVIRLPPDCWQGVLYNFNVDAYEVKTPTICGRTDRSYGWAAWESWGFMEEMVGPADCVDLRSVYSGVNVDGMRLAQLEKEEVNHGICFTSSVYDIRQVHVGPGTYGVFDWVAETPNPK